VAVIGCQGERDDRPSQAREAAFLEQCANENATTLERLHRLERGQGRLQGSSVGEDRFIVF
jgi:hypothetical protein